MPLQEASKSFDPAANCLLEDHQLTIEFLAVEGSERFEYSYRNADKAESVPKKWTDLHAVYLKKCRRPIWQESAENTQKTSNEMLSTS